MTLSVDTSIGSRHSPPSGQHRSRLIGRHSPPSEHITRGLWSALSPSGQHRSRLMVGTLRPASNIIRRDWRSALSAQRMHHSQLSTVRLSLPSKQSQPCGLWSLPGEHHPRLMVDTLRPAGNIDPRLMVVYRCPADTSAATGDRHSPPSEQSIARGLWSALSA